MGEKGRTDINEGKGNEEGKGRSLEREVGES